MDKIENWSGERLETFVLNENTLEHLHRYAIACNYVKGKTVLDIASGEGYGSSILSNHAIKVYGCDIDEKSVLLAKEKYKNTNLQFKVGSADSIPLEDKTVDVVVSFETLEHHDKHNEMMMEIKRVLKPNGILIISTPEKKHYSIDKNYTNPYHVKELYLNEFKQLLSSHFLNVKLFYQNMLYGSYIIPEDGLSTIKNFKGNYDTKDFLNHFEPLYLLGIATNDENWNAEIFSSTFTSHEVVENIANSIYRRGREDGASWIKNSKSYKLGNFLLGPFKKNK